MKGGKIVCSALSECNSTKSKENCSIECKRRKMENSASEEKFGELACWNNTDNQMENSCADDSVCESDVEMVEELDYSIRIPLDNSFESGHENNNGNIPKDKIKKSRNSKAAAELKSPANITPKHEMRMRDALHTDGFAIHRRKKSTQPHGTDVFELLSDEMVIQIFRWLPKASLRQCASVSQRWYRLVSDESLWSRIDLGGSGRTLCPGSLAHVLSRGTQVLRLSSAEIPDPVFAPGSKFITECASCKVQYLDLSMSIISSKGLTKLLETCLQLRKLSLEQCQLGDKACIAIGRNENLEVLNLCSCSGITEMGIKSILCGCSRLQSLNLAWTGLNLASINFLSNKLPATLQRINVSGCRQDLMDSHVESLVRCCPDLVELDLSDCTKLTERTISAVISGLPKIEYLALSRCYHIPTAAYTLLTSAESLMYLDVFGLMTEQTLASLQYRLSEVDINKFYFSSVARPTVGIRRTSIWGLRVRD